MIEGTVLPDRERAGWELTVRGHVRSPRRAPSHSPPARSFALRGRYPLQQ